MTEEERKALIMDFLANNTEGRDEKTAQMLNLLAESMAYSKICEMLPALPTPESPNRNDKKIRYKITAFNSIKRRSIKCR